VVGALDFCAGARRRRLPLLAVRSAEGGVLVPGPQRDGLSCGARAGCSGWLVGLLGEGAGGPVVMRASARAMADESPTLAAQLMNSSSMSSNLFFAMLTPPSWSP
jgi:hypothetical protein